MSCENDCGTARALPFDLRAYQRTYPDRVRAYFRATGLSAVQIAVQFGVSERTAQNWLEGVVGAHGAVVVRIAATDPDGFRRYFVPGQAA